MHPGDMVYYLYTDNNGTPIKLAAVVLGRDDNGVLIRVGRYDVHTREVASVESVVTESSLQTRSLPCSYEHELQGKT